MIDYLTPLLKDPNYEVRAAVAMVLVAVCNPETLALESYRTQSPLPALIAAYKEQPPGEARDNLAKAVYAIGGRKVWEQLSGNDHGILAVFRVEGDAADSYVSGKFEFGPSQSDGLSFNTSTLLLERLDDKGHVAEKKELSPEKLYVDTISPSLVFIPSIRPVHFSMDGCTPGLWRMTVQGVAGIESARWKSEPRLFHLKAAPSTGQPPTLASRIVVFDP